MIQSRDLEEFAYPHDPHVKGCGRCFAPAVRKIHIKELRRVRFGPIFRQDSFV